MIIRTATVADIPALAQIHRAIFPEGPWDNAFWAAAIAEDHTIVLIASAPSMAVGLCATRLAADEAEVLTLGVLPEARGGQIGRRLIQATYPPLAQAGAAHLFLEVAEDNAAAQGLYAAEGFVPMGRRPHYYGPGRDALILGKPLPGHEAPT